MSLSRLVMIALAGGVLTACAGADPVKTPQSSPTQSTTAASPTPDEFATARATYAKDCAVCHGDNGEGKTAEIEGKKIKAPSLATGHAVNHTDPDFVKQIAKGGEGMPAFEKKMSPKEIDEMVHFIRSVFQAGGKRAVSKP
jgi:mono/diheme cytochrome c family protein